MYNCKLDSLRGYSYKLKNSIINCPHLLKGGIIMPLANSIQFYDRQKTVSLFQSKRQISALDFRGKFLCIGERANAGQLISAVLLDIDNLDKPKIFNYQKTQISFISVSPSGQFICSVGSSSEGTQQLNIIDLNSQSQVGTRVLFKKVIKKKDGKVKAVKFSNKDPTFFVLLCTLKVTLMRIDSQDETVEQVQVKTSKVREYNNIIFSPDDQFLYGCSKNGDIAEISVDQNKQVRVGPRKRVITKGITNIKYLHPGYLVISGTEGLIGLIEIKTMSLLKQIRLQDEEIYSMSQFYQGQCIIATNKAMIYSLSAKTMETELIYACHSTKINALSFVKDFDDIFGTCSGSEIVVWRTSTMSPILKIAVPKITCLSIFFPKNGKYILSGWDDDSIRIFSPANGTLLLHIRNTNLQKVTALISDYQSTQMICGGHNGVIRIWNILSNKMFGLILGSLAFHMKSIHYLQINQYNQDQLVSCCEDGKFAIWSLSKFQLRSNFFLTNFLKQVSFIDQTTIRAVGAGNIIYECLISNGNIINEIVVNGTFVNSAIECFFDTTGETLIFYGGDSSYLYYYDVDYLQLENHSSLLSYGPINRMGLTSDKSTIIAVTENGIILKYSIFAVTKQSRQEQYY